MGGGSTFGNFGEEGAPGFVDPFTTNLLGLTQGLNTQTMTNRYNQLGMGGSTPEQMDLGNAPSVTGGMKKQFQGLLGELQNSSAQTAALGAGTQSIANQIGTGLNAFSK
jgi:hypothetical protein